MPVKLGDDDGADLNGLVEGEGLVVARLTDRAVHHEDGGVRFHSGRHLLHLFEKSCLLFMPTRGINYDDLKFLLFEEVHALLSNLNWVRLFLVTEKGTLNLGCIHL